MSFFIEKEVECNFNFDYEKVAEAVVSASLEHESFPYEAEVNLTLTDNEGIHAINKEYRQIDRPTDVLSFPMIDYPEPGTFDFLEEEEDCFDPESGELTLGDIVISVDKVREQAKEYGHSEQRELAFLVAHSMFHLFGYDHMEEEERKEMEKMQREVLDKLGIVR